MSKNLKCHDIWRIVLQKYQDIAKAACFGSVRPHPNYDMTWNTPFSILSYLPISIVSSIRTFWVASRLVVYKVIQNSLYFEVKLQELRYISQVMIHFQAKTVHTLEYISKPKLCHAPWGEMTTAQPHPPPQGGWLIGILYFMVYEIIPIKLGRMSSPTNPLNNHGFFHCSSVTLWGAAVASTLIGPVGVHWCHWHSECLTFSKWRSFGIQSKNPMPKRQPRSRSRWMG